MNYRLKNFATNLLDQQMWLFGQDIRYPDGNLLIQFGFEKLVCPKHLKRGNMYRLFADCGRQVCLWGFGILYQEESRGAVLIRRSDFAPKYFGNLNLRRPIFGYDHFEGIQQLRAGDANKGLVCNSIKWIETYEASILSVAGKQWRHRCIAGWKPGSLSYAAMTSGWKILRKRLKHHEKRHTS